MPYPNEHAARITDPDIYDKIRRENDKFGPGIHVIWGVRENGDTEVQAIRFDRAKFTVEEAKKWLEEHDYKPIKFESASGESAPESNADTLANKIAAKIVSAVMPMTGKLTNWVKFLQPGTHPSSPEPYSYTEAECDEIVRNYNRAFKAAKVDKDHEDTGPTLGTVWDVRRNGKWVEARLLDVPDDFKGEVNRHLWNEISPVIVPKIENMFPEAAERNGLKGMYLLGLSFLGAKTGAVPEQPEIQLAANTKKIRMLNNTPEGENRMGEPQILVLQEQLNKLQLEKGASDATVIELKAKLASLGARERMARVTGYLEKIETVGKRKFTPAFRDALTQFGLHAYAADEEKSNKILRFAAEGFDPKVDMTVGQIFEAIGKGIMDGSVDLTKVFAPPAEEPPAESEVEQRTNAADDVKGHQAIIALADGETSGDKYKAAVEKAKRHLAANPTLKTVGSAAIELSKKGVK